MLRKLSNEEMNAYRAPFKDREARLPTLVWPRELPIEGEPADVVEIVENNGQWLARSHLPKLFVNGEPGAIITGRARDFCRTFLNQREVTVKGLHFLQEDSPKDIGVAIREFVLGLAAQLARLIDEITTTLAARQRPQRLPPQEADLRSTIRAMMEPTSDTMLDRFTWKSSANAPLINGG